MDDTEEIQDTIDTIGNVIEPVKETKQQPDIVEQKLAEEASVIEPCVDIQPPPKKDHNVESQLPPITTTTQEEQIEVEKEKPEKKDEEKKTEEKKMKRRK